MTGIGPSTVLALIPSDANAWRVTGPVRYESRNVTLELAFGNVHTCWPGHGTFEEVARQINEGASPAPDMVNLRRLADEFDGTPLLIPCFRHGDLKRIWPAEYPPTDNPSDDALIAEDGNHRLAALARRALRGDPVAVAEVRLFVARLT